MAALQFILDQQRQELDRRELLLASQLRPLLEALEHPR